MNILEKLNQLENEAAAFGFKWENAQQIMAQIRSECDEVQDQLAQKQERKQQQNLQDEIGDLLHAAFSLCVFCQFDPGVTLENAVNKFESRFRKVQEISRAQGLTTLNGLSFAELMAIWQQAKQMLAE